MSNFSSSREPGACCQRNSQLSATIQSQKEQHLEDLLLQLDAEGFDPPTRSMYFVWVDRYIIDNREATRESMGVLARGMVDGRFIHNCHIYDVMDEGYLLVCRFTLAIYDIVFVLPSRQGYLAGKKYFMRIKGRIDLVSLRQLFKTFRIGTATK